MNDEARNKQQSAFEANVTIYAWTKWHQDRSIVFFFGKRKFVESFNITLNMTSIANETEPCKEPLWREDRWRPWKERSGAASCFCHCGCEESLVQMSRSDQGIQINAVPKEKRIFMPSSVSVASLEGILVGEICWEGWNKGLTGNRYGNDNFFKIQVHFRINISICLGQG